MNWYKYNINYLSENEYNKWFSLMNTKKQNRVNAYRNINAKKRSVCGELLVKKNISNLLGICADTIKIETLDNGKPYAANVDVHFSISHSSDYVVCAIDNSPIAIDIEQIKPINLKIAKRICTEKELTYIFSKTPINRDFTYSTDNSLLTKFFKIWTFKEAYIKLNGFIDFKSIDYFSIDKNYFEFDSYCVCIITSKN